MNRPTTAPPKPGGAAKKEPAPASKYVGVYHCTSDGLLYRITHTDSLNTSLQMQRRRPEEPEWREPYPVNTDPKRDDIKRLLDYGSFTRL